MVKPTLSLDRDKSDGRVRCTAHDWRTGRPPLERTGWPGHAGPGPRKPLILRPQHSGGRADEGCGDPSSKYAAGRQGGGKVQEPRGQRAAEGGLHLPSHLPPTDRPWPEPWLWTEGCNIQVKLDCTLVISWAAWWHKNLARPTPVQTLTVEENAQI